MIVAVIGRGHSGTRIISHALSKSGFFMGSKQNISGDTLHPRFGKPRDMYSACKLVARHVRYVNDFKWDFSEALSMEPTKQFVVFVTEYLSHMHYTKSINKGWKLPETILAHPWIVKMFPDIKYIYWIRDPRDCILKEHFTDELDFWNIPHGEIVNKERERMVSWKYQSEIFKATPEPKHLIKIKYEDFILDQEHQLKRLSKFLGVCVEKVLVTSKSIGRWRIDVGRSRRKYKMFESELKEYGYEW